jgi:hypothetical protein
MGAAMSTQIDQAIADALAFSQARGAELLVLLGDFDVWRGDLAEMRGDSPRTSRTPDATEVAGSDNRLTHALMMMKAAELLAGRLPSAGKTDVEILTTALHAQSADADENAREYQARLIQIYEQLRDTDDESAVTPEWIKNAATMGSASRR